MQCGKNGAAISVRYEYACAGDEYAVDEGSSMHCSPYENGSKLRRAWVSEACDLSCPLRIADKAVQMVAP